LYFLLNRKFKQSWSTAPPISTKRTTNHWSQYKIR